MKQLTVSSLSKHSGLSAQTIRNYADLGLIDVEESAENGYRYFSASSVNQTYAVRRLSELGFSMAEVQEIMQPPAPERYGDMLDALYQKTQREIQYEQDVLRMLSIHQESLQGFQNSLNCGRIISGGTFYCLDYTRNRKSFFRRLQTLSANGFAIRVSSVHILLFQSPRSVQIPLNNAWD